MIRVAVLDADARARSEWGRILARAGYGILDCPTAGRFLDATLEGGPEVVLVGARTPGMDGRELVRVLRADPRTKGILAVVVGDGRDGNAEAVAAFQAGADEFLTRPVDAELLLARLPSLLRRARAAASSGEELLLGDLSVLPDARECRVGAAPVNLTRLEFDLLAYLARHQGRVATRGNLLREVWRGDPGMGTRTVDKHVENLRRKLGPAGRRIQTVARVGYLLR